MTVTIQTIISKEAKTIKSCSFAGVSTSSLGTGVVFPRICLLYTSVNDADSVIPVLDKEKYAGYLEQGAIHAGMIPKLDNAFKTIKAGVKSVRLTDRCV